MLKDNENMPLFEDGPVGPSEPRGFAPSEMVRCEICLRANPPTRVNCLYCAAVLPVSEDSSQVRQPTLRPLEKWEQGYNIILKPLASDTLSTSVLSEAAALLKSTPEIVERLISFKAGLPLCRVASVDEASLIRQRLEILHFDTEIVSDEELEMHEPVNRIRAAQIGEDGIMLMQAAGANGSWLPWADVRLLARGQLLTKEIETRDQKTTRGEAQLLDASEMFTDEAVLDIYGNDPRTYRISANNFDFSCLGTQKTLLVSANFAQLINLLRIRAPHAEYDDSYRIVRQTLEVAWPSERQTVSRGWRREYPGKYSIGSVTANSNEVQLTRYTRLLYVLKKTAAR